MSTPPFLTLPPSARSLRLTTGRGEFAALWGRPAGAPVRGTALLLPGFTGSKEDFIALLDPLARAGFQTVAVDQRGQYETGGPDDEAAYTLDALAQDLFAITAYVVREALLRAADAGPLPWDSLTLLSTGPSTVCADEAGRAELLMAALQVMDLEAIWQAMREMEAAAGTAPTVRDPEVAEFMHRRWLANVPASLHSTARQLTVEPDRVDELALVGLPKLVVSGESDYAWPVNEQAKMAARLGARYVTVAGAGHSPNAENPHATAEALAEFWLTLS